MTDVDGFQPTWASPPGDTIAAVLRDRGFTQADLAGRTGYTKKHINDLVRGRASISFEAALKLEAVLGSTADFWMRREVQFREALARQQVNQEHAKSASWLKTLPLSSMIKAGWVEKRHDDGQQVAECLRFFAVASVSAWNSTYSKMLAAFRSAPAAKISGPAAAAWIRQGEILASEIVTAPYSASALRRAIPNLRALTAHTIDDAFISHLRSICADAGIAVVSLAAPKGCPAYGATEWISPTKALLLLSSRYKSQNVLWFTFFHEICHLLYHSKKLTVIEGAPDLDRELEAEADRFAANVLLRPE
jgi:HTH-type transcriptional regulator/antitoxin HigA